MTANNYNKYKMEYHTYRAILNSTNNSFISPTSSFNNLRDTLYSNSTINYTNESFDDERKSKIECHSTTLFEIENSLDMPLYYPTPKDMWKDLIYPDYFKIFLSAIVIVGGFLGNISVIMAIILNKSKWKLDDIFIVNLAVADTMICIFCMLPHALTVATARRYFWGEIMCKFNTFTEMTCLICSVFTLSVIMWNCRYAIMFPLKPKPSKKHALIFVIVMWTVSIAVSIPLLIVRKHLEIKWLDFTEYQCEEKWPIYRYVDRTTNKCVSQKILQLIYYIVVLTTLYFLPLVIMTIACFSIIWALKKNKFNGRRNSKDRKTEKATRSVILLLFVFIICWTPIQVKVMYSVFFEQSPDGVPEWLLEIEWAIHFIAYSNSFLNPIIYGGYKRVLTLPGGSSHIFLTRLTSSLSRQLSKLRHDVNNTLQQPNIEMKLVHPVGNGDISPAPGDKCVSKVEAEQ